MSNMLQLVAKISNTQFMGQRGFARVFRLSFILKATINK